MPGSTVKNHSILILSVLFLLSACDDKQPNAVAVSGQAAQAAPGSKWLKNTQNKTAQAPKKSSEIVTEVTWYSWLSDILSGNKSASNKTKTTSKPVNSQLNKSNATDNTVVGAEEKSAVNANVDPFTGLDAEQQQILKQNYFCDLAYNARITCESQPRNEKSMEICLKLAAYFTNSRQCGHQP